MNEESIKQAAKRAEPGDSTPDQPAGEKGKQPYIKPELEEPKEIRSFCATDIPI